MSKPETIETSNTLDVIALDAGYNGLPAVREISLSVAPGEIVALLGSNGAGKTTTLSAIAGLIKPMEGTINLAGASTAGRSAHKLARAGVALVPEDRALFHDLTTRENLRVASPRGKSAESEARVLEFLPELAKCLDRKAGYLSGGEQQMLAVGRALVGSPTLLIVDEMSLGLAPVVVERLLPVLQDVARELNAAVLVVEQHVALAMEVASRAYVLAHGRIVLHGDTSELKSSQELIEASYFGDADAVSALAGDASAMKEGPP